MPRYRYTGLSEAQVFIRDESGYLDEILQPGQEFETEVGLHNPIFERLSGRSWVPALRSPELIGEFDGTGSHLETPAAPALVAAPEGDPAATSQEA